MAQTRAPADTLEAEPVPQDAVPEDRAPEVVEENSQEARRASGCAAGVAVGCRRFVQRLLAAVRTPVGALGLVAVLLAVSAAVLVASLVNATAADDGRIAALAAARKTATDLTTISRATAAQNLDTLLADSTGDFRAQFAQQSEGFQKVLDVAQIDSEGRVDEAGLVSFDGDTATALVAVTATVKNSQSPEGDLRQYRIRTQLAREDGAWLVSQLEFVS